MRVPLLESWDSILGAFTSSVSQVLKVHLQPQKSLKTSCVSNCIGFKKEREFQRNSKKFETQIIPTLELRYGEIPHTSSGRVTGIVDKVSKHSSYGIRGGKKSSCGSPGIAF